MKAKQNLTVQLDRDTIRKAKVLAAKQGTSVSKLIAQQIHRLIGEDESYEAAQRTALGFLQKGFHLGGGIA